jgi:hypothetical protein
MLILFGLNRISAIEFPVILIVIKRSPVADVVPDVALSPQAMKVNKRNVDKIVFILFTKIPLQ